MTTESLPLKSANAFSGRLRAVLTAHWALILGFAAMAIPTIISLAQQSWSTEAGAHGPIVLATGIWLFFQIDRARLRDMIEPPNWILIGVLTLIAVPVYIFGRAYDFLSVEAAALYLVFLIIAYRFVGWRAMAGNMFPFIYLGFLVPIPGFIIDRITMPLQHFISWVTTSGLHELGYPVMRHGVTLFIAQYQLLVEQACSGMNSLMGLISISMFYIYVMHRASWRYAWFLFMLVLPVAIFTNLLRVIALVLITYYFGDAAAQGFLHSTAGILLFVVALTIIFGLDMLFQSIMARRERKRA